MQIVVSAEVQIMFLAGISEGEAAALVIIKKSLKNLQKHYLIKSVRVFPSDTDCADIENADHFIRWSGTL